MWTPFRKRENQTKDENREQTGATMFDPESLGDVLLQALIQGEPISRKQAQAIPAVAADVDFICSMVASMPIKLYKHKDDKVEEQTKDTRVKLLNGDTGDTLDAYQMKYAMVEDYLLGRGGYCYIERSRNDVTGLYYVEDEFICISMDLDNPIYKTYKIYCGTKVYDPYDFIKILRKTKDGAQGVGVTQDLGKALETAYQTMLYQLQLVKTGGNKRGFLKSERKLGEAEITALKQAWRNLYANNTESVVVLNNGLDFKEAASTSVEMQLNESVKSLQEQIHDIFHISDDFYLTFKKAIYPILRAFETALNRDLLLENEKKNLFFEFDVKEILKTTSIKERYEAYKVAKEAGWITINEIRRRENMDMLPGLNVCDFGLASVLYNVDTQTYYTPNTGDIKQEEEAAIIDNVEGTV